MDKKHFNRKRRSIDLPMCKYGLSCYQKNPEHRKKYRHPDTAPEEVLTDDEVIHNSTIPPAIQEEPLTKKCAKGSKKETLIDESNSEVQNLTGNSFSSTLVPKFTETVQEALESMPEDFFDFWKFCSSINKSKPEDAFAELGLHLVGMYDLLAKQLPKDKKIALHCHWRYFYDPPEFQTVLKFDGKDLYHIGYFRDEPSKKPTILASNSVTTGPKLTLKGDNIFAAVNAELKERIQKLKPKQQEKISKILKSLKKFAEEKKYALEIQSSKTKARSKKVVAKTFHGIGIVVSVENDIGYRPLPDSDATIKSILKRIVTAENENKRLQVEESLDEIITNVQFANDECDFGMGLELGLDLFCYGEPYFHSHILHILPLAYDLLKRSKYGEIVRFHLVNRKKTDELNALND